MKRVEPYYCELCECVCVLCAQLQGCDDCELLHPELLNEPNEFSESLIDCLNSQNKPMKNLNEHLDK
jgi:hypothetical protein